MTEPAAFENSDEAHIFRFIHQGPERPLGEYLRERYSYGRSAEWRESFFPGRVRLNGHAVDEATLVAPGDEVAYRHLRSEEPPAPPTPPVLYQDNWLLALHKPDCIPVNPSGVYYFTCLAILARERFGDRGLTPVHRLDLETSGPLLLARRRKEVRHFQALFDDKSIRKRYRALVHGAFPPELREIAGRIVPDRDSRIATKLRLEPGEGEQHSLTRILGVTRRGDFSELLLEPVTGKTNQLRVHLAAVGHPIVGDKKYHPDEGLFLDWVAHRDFNRLRRQLLLPRQALQCESLEFPHPFTEEQVSIAAPPQSWPEKLAGLELPG